MPDDRPHPGSFRDPWGFVFRRGGRLLRQINRAARPAYDRLMSCGLYDELARDGLLVRHEETDEPPLEPDRAYKVLAPEPVPLVSYPYEWCFSALRDAALLTLEIQRRALAHGLTLRDASAFNVQLRAAGRAVFIDTLSFGLYEDGAPWTGYRQFCEQFLAPLALMAYADPGASRLLRVHLDGIPLGAAARMLPLRTRLRTGLAAHLHLHARAQRRWAGRPRPRQARMGRLGLAGLIDSLARTVRRLHAPASGSTWTGYANLCNYSAAAWAAKRDAVAAFVDETAPSTVWDLGANTGAFSRLAAERGARVAAFDADPACVESAYQDVRGGADARILPLLMDLANPSPCLGWANRERASLFDRGPADVALALALVHHLAVGRNVPLNQIAEVLAGLCRDLLVEFVPREDSQVQGMLAGREELFADYTRAHFEAAFERKFSIRRVHPLPESGRVLYAMARRAT